LSFVYLRWSRTTDKLAINYQNFALVQLQLKFAFIVRSYLSFFALIVRLQVLSLSFVKLKLE